MLKVYPLTVICRFVSTAVFPEYKGFSLRGAFGSALKSTCCPLVSRWSCQNCGLKGQCAYFNIFLPEKEKDQRDKDIPRPFLFQAGFPEKRYYQAGESFSFGLVLFGEKIIKFFPFLLLALHRMGQKGIGLPAKRGKFFLERVFSYKGDVIYEKNKIVSSLKAFSWERMYQQNSDCFSLKFLTPTRLKKDGRLLGPEGVNGSALLSSIRRRVYLLEKFYNTDGSFELSSAVDSITKIEVLSSDLIWRELKRFSSRQGVKMKMGGLLGDVRFRVSAENLEKVYYVFSLLQFIHLGKNTVFGLGRISINSIRRVYGSEITG